MVHHGHLKISISKLNHMFCTLHNYTPSETRRVDDSGEAELSGGSGEGDATSAEPFQTD